MITLHLARKKASNPENRVSQFGQRKLAILERLPEAVFDDPALQINRLSGWWRLLDTHAVFENPSYLLEVLLRPSSRSSRCLQLVEQFLEFLWRHASPLFLALHVPVYRHWS